MNLKKITSKIQNQINTPIVTRFAPSPSGYLHLGHIASALFVWGFAKATQGKVILRIEDHDRQRSKKEFEKAIIEDLAWLGLKPDLGCNVDTVDSKTPFRQSDCQKSYDKHLNGLIGKDLIYGCDCSRKKILESMSANKIELKYDGNCRELNHSIKDGIGIRCKLENKTYEFDDLLLGKQVQCPIDQCGDLLIKDKNGNWTYQYAVTIDDSEQGINLVIRGQDLTHTTARQMQLMDSLGFKQKPFYLRHPLIKKENSDVKLSKKDFATSIRDRKKMGASPEQLIGEAAFATGITALPSPINLNDLFKLF